MDVKTFTEEFMLKNKTELESVNPDYVYKPRFGDVIVSGPGKAGTTWLQQILHQIRTKGDETFTDIYDVTWMAQFPLLAKHFNFNNEQVCNPRIYKYHKNFETIPKADGVKYIVIVRNPLDSVYSYCKFAHRYFGGNTDVDEVTIKEWIERDITSTGKPIITFTKSWWSHRRDPNVFWVHYEDLLKNLQLITKEIADFIKIPLTDEELNHICSFCTFEYMSDHPQKFRGDSVMELIAQIMDCDKWQINSGMVRTDGGTSGQGMKLGNDLKQLMDNYWYEFITREFGFENYAQLYAEGSRLK